MIKNNNNNNNRIYVRKSQEKSFWKKHLEIKSCVLDSWDFFSTGLFSVKFQDFFPRTFWRLPNNNSNNNNNKNNNNENNN